MSHKNYIVECGANLEGGFFKRNIYINPKDTLKIRAKYNNKGLYITPYIYDSANIKASNIIADFYIDLDYDLESSEDAFSVIQTDAQKIIKYFNFMFKIKEEEIKIFFSGSKGLHIIIPKEVLGIEAREDLNMIFKKMASDITQINHLKTLDLKIYDKRRLLRMINSMHPKTNLYKVQISYEELLNLKFNEIKQIAQNPRPIIENNINLNKAAAAEFKNYIKKYEMTKKEKKPTPVVKIKNTYKPPCIEYIFNNPILNGQRNATMVFLASYCLQNGYSEEEALDLINEWNDKIVNPPIEDKEILTSVHSIFSGAHSYGCAMAQTVSICDKKKCQIWLRR